MSIRMQILLSVFDPQGVNRDFGNPLARGVADSVKRFHAPRQTLRTGAAQPFVAETIETKVPKFKTVAVIALAERIKFGMKFIKQIAILLRHRMSLHQIGSNCNHATLAENDAAMTLGAINVQTQFFCKTIDVAGTIHLLHVMRGGHRK